jgi:hypothetical protein
MSVWHALHNVEIKATFHRCTETVLLVSQIWYLYWGHRMQIHQNDVPSIIVFINLILLVMLHIFSEQTAVTQTWISVPIIFPVYFIPGFPYNTVKNSDYTALNDRMISEWVGNYVEGSSYNLITYFKILSQHLPRGSKENHEIP